MRLPSLAEIENVSQKISERLDDLRAQTEVTTPRHINKTIEQPKIAAPQRESKQISMTKEALIQRPDLLSNALNLALLQGNTDTVEFLFPLYQKMPKRYQDSGFIKWSEAILARHYGDYTKTIQHYREILATYPEATAARLQLAIALFENNQYEASEDQFQKVRSDNIPNEIKALTDKYLSAMSYRDRWNFSGGITYLNDPNINNAPKGGTRYGNWTAPKSESAQGFGFNFNIGKKWSWGNGFYNELRLDTNGKYYWNNKKYNEVSTRGNFGLGYQTARLNIALLPFMEQTWYAGGSKSSESIKRFSKSGGTMLETTYWISPQWQWNNAYEYAEMRYMDRLHLNGNYHFISSGLTYLTNANQYWFTNLNYNRTSTRDKDDSYIRRGLNLGWGQEWNLGVSTRLSLSYAQKNYKAPMPIFSITQRNKEYGVTASIWHRAIHYWGITPRLTYSFTKVKSNHTFYSYDKHRVFIEFSKRF
ncbi:porin family protein [Actinobacillus arthritidis]|uniref:porin family protein n=1 Tax=Actinobacillus arthritidis TaxID=157339 RepID=UPI00244308B7|nr:porin family protein [Actinobacillus arthritidis]WGE88857.1 surface lipoprotein assembly modifier [Actinobacillus arthritidis]